MIMDMTLKGNSQDDDAEDGYSDAYGDDDDGDEGHGGDGHGDAD